MNHDMDCYESFDCDEISEAVVALLPATTVKTCRPASKRRPVRRIILLNLILFACLVPFTLKILSPIQKDRNEPLPILSGNCQNPPRRREWRSLREEEQYNLIRAVQCLVQLPSNLGLPTTRYNDFVYVHIETYETAHSIAPFLPWHRYYIHAFEKALKEECGYEGHLPYWDWTLDATRPEESPVWSPKTGFGGNGDPDAYNCVTDGPFSEIKLKYPKPHCLWRNFIHGLNGFNYTTEIVSNILQNSTSYNEFRKQLESGPHQAIHNGIGGEMPREWSPNEDPIFFLHHAQIDRLWWTWQQMHPLQRSRDYFGPMSNDTTSTVNGILDDSMSILGLAKNITVFEVMITESPLLCYRY